MDSVAPIAPLSSDLWPLSNNGLIPHSRGEACMTFFPQTGNAYLAGVCVIAPMAHIWVPESCRFYRSGPVCATVRGNGRKSSSVGATTPAPLMGH